MKKIAFFVEGQTELYFINKLLIEIAGRHNISIILKRISGGSKVVKIIQNIRQPITTHSLNLQFEALIYDCTGDDHVKSELLDNLDSLKNNGFSKIVGLRDLYPETDLNSLKRGINFIPSNKKPLALPFKIIIAVSEIETWFLAECNHYTCINEQLTIQKISQEIGYNPCTENMNLRFESTSKTLNQVYNLVNRTYSKKKNIVQTTINCLDFANLYVEIRHRIEALDELISEIDNFLSIEA